MPLLLPSPVALLWRVFFDDAQPVGLLPVGGLPGAVKPCVRRLSRAASRGHDLSSGILRNLFLKIHLNTMAENKLSAMRKILLALCLQCGHYLRMTTVTATHELTRMIEDRRSLHYSGKSWSARFDCPACGKSQRANTNFLGRHKMMCNGARVQKVKP